MDTNINPIDNKNWVKAIESLSKVKIEGFKVECPVCGKNGIAFSYWVPKLYEKPIYICHTRYHKLVSVCELDKEQRNRVRKEIDIPKDDIVKILRNFRPFLLFSGGKDSLSTLHYVKRINGNRKNGITVLHADTTAGLPKIRRYVRRVCKRFELDVNFVKPKEDFFSLAKKWGIPSPKSRWCCKTLKIRPIRDYLKSVDGPKVVIDGIRGAESNARANYLPLWYHPGFDCLSLSPIFYWDDDEVNDYIVEHRLPKMRNDNFGASAECFCGAYSTRGDFEALLDSYPDIFDKLIEVEKANDYGYTFIYENGEKIPLEELKKLKKNQRQ